MRNNYHLFLIFAALFLASAYGCKQKAEVKNNVIDSASYQLIAPSVITEKVKHDSDDPAIWVNQNNPEEVLIIGTDKGGDTGDGGLYLFNLEGKKIDSVRSLKRPNNVDIAYNLKINGKLYDIAVCTERNAKSIRVFSLPDLQALDGGGLPVFEGEADSLRDPMGIALYTEPISKNIYAIVGRKTGPKDGTYLWQYLLEDNGKGQVKATLKRKLGFYSGLKEIESIAVDNELGYIYHSDEMHGIHKSYAHPDSSNVELSLFGQSGFTEDIEGISIYKTSATTGFILVSDQQASKFRIFKREGENKDPNQHTEITFRTLQIVESDGSDVTNHATKKFPKGFFVAMTDDGTFQIYDWRDLKIE
ncbi:MAG: phytase [Cyclobacteriaceae bacterium]|jgi:3-phytase|nr:phytase [Cyclobacteriaceae bacterium]